ncbi:MAG: sulfurtransferase TusA family protein [Alphaproteobacteria bacterium]|nr:sulfurtransferase TusA family protein [Alphaproteobacteria bacterium]
MSNTGQTVSGGTPDESSITVLDVSGLQCPLPVLKAQKALRSLAPGDVLQVISTDPMATIDIPHFCTEHRHKLLRQEPHGEAVHYYLEKG